MEPSNRWWVKVTKNEGQNVRKSLENAGIYDKSRKVKVNKNQELEIPITESNDIEQILNGINVDYSLFSCEFVPESKTTLAENLYQTAKKVRKNIKSVF